MLKKILPFICILFLITLICLYKAEFSIEFEPYKEYQAENISNLDTPCWFTLRDEKYGGFYGTELLEKYGIDTEKCNFDFSKNTYVVTVGHKLKEIKFSFSKMKNRKFVFIPKQFVGITGLEYECSPKIYIYKIKRTDIDCNYHEPYESVYFVKGE